MLIENKEILIGNREIRIESKWIREDKEILIENKESKENTRSIEIRIGSKENKGIQESRGCMVSLEIRWSTELLRTLMIIERIVVSSLKTHTLSHPTSDSRRGVATTLVRPRLTSGRRNPKNASRPPGDAAGLTPLASP